MTPREELIALRRLSNLLTDEEREIRKQTRGRRLIHSGAFVALIVAFMPFIVQAELIGLAAAALAALAGCVAGFAMYWSNAAKQWPVIRPHINVESVSNRIKKLEA